jgi:Protein of unknown function (DUF2510)
MPEAGWYRDPSKRQSYRYWSGSMWSDMVSDGAETSDDRLEHQFPMPTGAAVSFGPVSWPSTASPTPDDPSEEIAWRCGVCGRGFSNVQEMNAHVRAQHSEVVGPDTRQKRGADARRAGRGNAVRATRNRSLAPRSTGAKACAAAAVAILLIAVVVIVIVAVVSGGGSSGESCAKAVDALSADITLATNAADISSSPVKKSFDECGGPELWKVSADVDNIGDEIQSKGDMNPSATMSTDDALDFLCARFDSGNSTDTCSGR